MLNLYTAMRALINNGGNCFSDPKSSQILLLLSISYYVSASIAAMAGAFRPSLTQRELNS